MQLLRNNDREISSVLFCFVKINKDRTETEKVKEKSKMTLTKARMSLQHPSDKVILAVKALSNLNLGVQCPICLEVSKCPIRIPCGHNFCRMCLDHHLQVNIDDSSSSQSPGTRRTKTCPLCKFKLNKRR
jgi:hypothetical protein